MISQQRKINEIVDKYKSNIPVNVVKLGRDLGLNVKKSKAWNNRTSGAIVKSGDTFTIWTNWNHSLTRRRFTVAHEIGHFVLHRHLIGDGIHDDSLFRSKLGGALEAEANRFAADLLMPMNLVHKEILNGATTIHQLAERFDVSEAAMSIRLGIPYE